MPFTPFHLGPGAALKAVAGKRFSFTVFGFTQVLIDVEPLVRLLRGDWVVHGFTHTLLGATLVAGVALLIGRPICQWLLSALRLPAAICWPAAVSGAFGGAYTHVLLDGIMHADLQPLMPFAAGNGLLGLLSYDEIHLLCLFSGLCGALWLGIVALWRWSHKL